MKIHVHFKQKYYWISICIMFSITWAGLVLDVISYICLEPLLAEFAVKTAEAFAAGSYLCIRYFAIQCLFSFFRIYIYIYIYNVHIFYLGIGERAVRGS